MVTVIGKTTKNSWGSPDIAVTKYKIAVFCDSEFFHGKDWNKLKTRLERGKKTQYWIQHIEETMDGTVRLIWNCRCLIGRNTVLG